MLSVRVTTPCRASMNSAVAGFLEELRKTGCTELTLRNYRADLRMLLRGIGGVEDAAGLAGAVAGYLDRLDVADRSWNRHLSTLRRFCDFLVETNILRANPLHGLSSIAVSSGGARPAGSRQVAALLQRIQRPRDRALVVLLLDTGLCIGEALALSVRDVSGPKGAVRVPGTHARCVTLSAAARQLMADYLRRRKAHPDEPAFVTYAGRPLSYAGAHRLFGMYAAGTGLTLRRLRASAAANAFRRGATLGQVQRMLGHAHAASTARYQGSALHRQGITMSKARRHRRTS